MQDIELMVSVLSCYIKIILSIIFDYQVDHVNLHLLVDCMHYLLCNEIRQHYTNYTFIILGPTYTESITFHAYKSDGKSCYTNMHVERWKSSPWLRS